MTHIRKLIRDKAVVQLTGLPHTQDRVYAWRGETIAKDQLPALKVMTPDQAPGAVTLIVEAIGATENADNLADWLDEMAADIEAAVEADRTFDGAALDARLASSTIAIDLEGDVQVGVATLTYIVTADTTGRRPAIKINDVTLERLRDLSLTRAVALTDISHSLSTFRQRAAKSLGDWTAIAVFALDDGAPAQDALTLKAEIGVKVYLEGLNGAFLAGDGIVSDIADDSGEGDEIVRTVTISGDGIIA